MAGGGGGGHSAVLQFSAVLPSKWIGTHTPKKWIEGNQKFIFQTQLDERVWLSWSLNKVELTKEDRYGIKLNVRISNSWWQVHYWELLVLKASWNSSFFCKCWSPFDFVFQDYSPGTALAKMFCVQLFNSWTASNSFVRKSSIEISWVWWQFY